MLTLLLLGRTIAMVLREYVSTIAWNNGKGGKDGFPGLTEYDATNHES